jgi:hypothetical protein
MLLAISVAIAFVAVLASNRLSHVASRPDGV